MRIGVFHPALNMYGGAEFVALVVANTLAQERFDIDFFANNEINQNALRNMMGEAMNSSVQATVKPSPLAPRGTWDILEAAYRSFIFKQRIDIVVDTYSSAIFPWSDVIYVHYPFLNDYHYRRNFPYIKNPRLQRVVGLPHALFSQKLQNYEDKLIIANSKFTAAATARCINADIKVIYPPVPSVFFQDSIVNSPKDSRKDAVITVSRFGLDKGLEKIPLIAKLTRTDVSFKIMGLLHDPKAYELIKYKIKEFAVTEKVTLSANAPRSEVKNALKESKLYLHTMIGEHFGISIVEAMAAGCIPIVHNSGGMREFVPPEYRYETIEEAAKIIENSLSRWTSNEAARMRRIAEEFREENFGKAFAQVFKEYLERKS